jgi:hypothetical protein
MHPSSSARSGSGGSCWSPRWFNNKTSPARSAFQRALGLGESEHEDAHGSNPSNGSSEPNSKPVNGDGISTNCKDPRFQSQGQGQSGEGDESEAGTGLNLNLNNNYYYGYGSGRGRGLSSAQPQNQGQGQDQDRERMDQEEEVDYVQINPADSYDFPRVRYRLYLQ